MSYRQEIHGQMPIAEVGDDGLFAEAGTVNVQESIRAAFPDVDELMEEAERKKRVEVPEDWDTEEELMGEGTTFAALAVPDEVRSVAFGPDAIIRTTGPTVIGPCGSGVELTQLRKEREALAEGITEDNPPEPGYSEEEKLRRAKESWEYNKMTQDLQGEPPGWNERKSISDLPFYEPLPGSGFGVSRPGTSEAAIEDEALRARIRAVLECIEFNYEWNDATFLDDMKELLGRYETLFALAEVYANASPVDRNGVYVSRRPRENVPGTDHL